jgi:hypothetical protein
VLRYVTEKLFKSMETVVENGVNAIEGAMKTARKLAEGFKDIKKGFPTVGHVIHVNAQQF